MSLDGRALRQQKLERAALDELLDGLDSWVKREMASITVDTPPSDLDEKGLEAWAEAQADKLVEQMARVNATITARVNAVRARALELSIAATGRLVEAQLPTAREVMSGVHDADRAG